MKRIKGFVKRNIKLLIGIVVGGIIFGGGVYAATVAANTVTYSNTSSGINSTNVQGAIDALYNKTNSLIDDNATAYRFTCKDRVLKVTINGRNLIASSLDEYAYLKAVSNCWSAGSAVGWTGFIGCVDTNYPLNQSNLSSGLAGQRADCCTELCGASSGKCHTICTSE